MEESFFKHLPDGQPFASKQRPAVGLAGAEGWDLAKSQVEGALTSPSVMDDFFENLADGQPSALEQSSPVANVGAEGWKHAESQTEEPRTSPLVDLNYRQVSAFDQSQVAALAVAERSSLDMSLTETHDAEGRRASPPIVDPLSEYPADKQASTVEEGSAELLRSTTSSTSQFGKRRASADCGNDNKELCAGRKVTSTNQVIPSPFEKSILPELAGPSSPVAAVPQLRSIQGSDEDTAMHPFSRVPPLQASVAVEENVPEQPWWKELAAVVSTDLPEDIGDATINPFSRPLLAFARRLAAATEEYALR
ncbi:hypothetical protein Efla_006139 [Eimeria flavescens]